MSLRALVLAGDGINCELETATALKLAGFEAEIRHINDLITARMTQGDLSKYSVLALPGGFSFGDELTSGKILALKIKHRLTWDLSHFVAKGGMAIGICNGFQALMKMGLFGGSVSITGNVLGKFVNTWTALQPASQKCLWLQGLGRMVLPVRHGEGRIVFMRSSTNESLTKLERSGMTCLKYVENPNGSDEGLAGLCDSTGRIFGLMPHPEAFVGWTSHPSWTRQSSRSGEPGDGLKIFENAFREAKAST